MIRLTQLQIWQGWPCLLCELNNNADDFAQSGIFTTTPHIECYIFHDIHIVEITAKAKRDKNICYYAIRFCGLHFVGSNDFNGLCTYLFRFKWCTRVLTQLLRGLCNVTARVIIFGERSESRTADRWDRATALTRAHNL